MSLSIRIKTCIILVNFILPFATFGQYNVPLGTLPMQFNSSFAGSNGGPRFSSIIGYERQFKDRYNYYEMYTSYDQFIPAIRSGIGISGGFSSQYVPPSGGWPSSNPYFGSVSLAIAPKFSIQGKYTISPALNFGYGQRWNSRYGNYIDGVLVIRGVNVRGISSGASVLFNSNKFYIGYAVTLIGKNYYSDTTASRSWNIIKDHSSDLQMGYTFWRSTSKFSFTPQLVIRINKYSNDNRFRVGLGAISITFRHNKFLWGLNNRGVHLGWQNEKLRFMLTNGLGSLLRSDDSQSYSVSLAFRYLIPSAFEKKYTVPGM